MQNKVAAVAVGLLAAVALVGLISMGSSPAELLAKPTHQAHKARVMHAAHKVQVARKLLPVAEAFPIQSAAPAPRATQPQMSASMAKYGTEQQALRNAKAWARQEYAATLKSAEDAENAAEVKERKNRKALAAHDTRRAARMAASKSIKDKNEGWGKLQNEMGMIMDGYDGLHYKAAAK